MKLDIKVVDDGKSYFGFSPYNNFVFQLDEASLAYILGHSNTCSPQIEKLLSLKLLFYIPEQVVIDNSFLFKIDTIFYKSSKREALEGYKALKKMSKTYGPMRFRKLNEDMLPMEPARQIKELFGSCAVNISEALRKTIDEAYKSKAPNMLSEGGLDQVKGMILSGRRRIRKCGAGNKSLYVDQGQLHKCSKQLSPFSAENQHEIKTVLDRSSCYGCFARYLCGGPCVLSEVVSETVCKYTKHCVELAVIEIIREKKNENMYRC